MSEKELKRAHGELQELSQGLDAASGAVLKDWNSALGKFESTHRFY